MFNFVGDTKHCIFQVPHYWLAVLIVLLWVISGKEHLNNVLKCVLSRLGCCFLIEGKINTFTIYMLELKSFNRPSYSVNGDATVYVVAMTHSLRAPVYWLRIHNPSVFHSATPPTSPWGYLKNTDHKDLNEQNMK